MFCEFCELLIPLSQWQIGVFFLLSTLCKVIFESYKIETIFLQLNF